MGELFLILLGIAIGCVAILILIPVFAFLVWYSKWWWIKIEGFIADREAREIYKFKKNL